MPFHLSRRHFLASTAGFVALHPFSARAAAGQAHLRIMETTDIHVNVFPYDYYGDRAVDTVGLARTAALIGGVRAESTNSLLLDNGDFLQGTPLGDYMAYEKGMAEGDLHPIVAAMNAVGIEAATVGNHEFNYGLDFLMKALARTDFPMVCANVVKTMGATPREDETLLPPYVILDRELTDGDGETFPIRIGIIGVVTPQIMTWDRKNLEGNVNTRDISTTAAAYVPQMKEDGAELIIALCHSGIGEADFADGAENAAIPLAAVEGIDVVLTGHAHLVFPGPDYAGRPGLDAEAGTIMGKPAVMGGFWGSHMGLVDLMLERDGNSWRVVGSQTEARPIYLRGDDGDIAPTVESVPAVLAAAQAEHDATLDYIRRAVGETDAPLQSYFALVADDPSVQIVNNAQTWYIEQMMVGTDNETVPILSAAAPFKAGGRGGPEYFTEVPTGPIAIKDVANLYLYPNTIRALKITGADVREWLERSAGMFNHIEPGAQDAILLNPDFPSYNFDVIDGVTYQIDLSQASRYNNEGEVVAPDAHRIVGLSFGGAPIDDTAEFIVVTNNYRAGGGGSFPSATPANTIFEGPDTNRDIIVRFIVELGTVSPSADANWTFAPMEGTTVLFETGPGAAPYYDAVKGVTMEPAGDGDDGFVLYRIML